MESLNDSLTPVEQRFAAAYAVLGEAHEAALRAGLPEHEAEARGEALLARPGVADAVALLREDAAAHDAVTRQWVVARLKEVAERCMQAAPAAPARGAAGKAAGGGDEVSTSGIWKFDAGAAIRALTLLGKHLRMFGGHEDPGDGDHENALDALE